MTTNLIPDVHIQTILSPMSKNSPKIYNYFSVFCVEGNQELRHLPVLLKGNFTLPISVHKLSKTVYCDDVICVGYHLNGACQPIKRSLDCLQIIPESDTQINTLNLQLERNKIRKRGIPISSPGKLSLIMLSILYNLMQCDDYSDLF